MKNEPLCVPHPVLTDLVVYKNGTVFSKRKDRLLSGTLVGRGYLCLNLKEGKRYIHRLVAEAYLGMNIDTVNHKNGNKLDNRLSNLESVTNLKNIQHARRTGLFSDEVTVIATDHQGVETKYRSITEAARLLGLDQGSISKHIQGRRKHVGGYTFRKDTI